MAVLCVVNHYLLQIKYEDQLFEICNEGIAETGDVSIVCELQNHGVDFDMFNDVSMNT